MAKGGRIVGLTPNAPEHVKRRLVAVKHHLDAGRVLDQLVSDRGYGGIGAVNATGSFEETAIYYVDGYELDAIQIAQSVLQTGQNRQSGLARQDCRLFHRHLPPDQTARLRQRPVRL